MTVSAASRSSGSFRLLFIAVAYATVVFTLLQQRYHVPPAPVHGPVADPFTAMSELMIPYGYGLEEHFSTTADGFILRSFRIPCSPRQSSQQQQCLRHWQPISATKVDGARSCTSSGTTNSSATSSAALDADLTAALAAASLRQGNCPPVLLQHALMDSSAGWLLQGPGKSLALLLADHGFDVWLGNVRGNRFSRNHTHLHPDQPAFWRWSFDQIAEFDFPAQLNTVAQVSGSERVLVIGYSQGTMVTLAALSSQPALARQVSAALLLAPVAFTGHMRSPPFTWSAHAGLDRWAAAKGWGEWGAWLPHRAASSSRLCSRWPWVCRKALEAVCGAHAGGSNMAAGLVSLLVQHLPAGTSVQNMGHWSQAIRRGPQQQHLFRYDWGGNCSHQVAGQPACNQAKYGQEVPPAYNLSAINTPLALFTGGQDTISVAPDVDRLKAALQPGLLVHHHHEPAYAHLDFELGQDAPERVYPLLLQLAKRFTTVTQAS